MGISDFLSLICNDSNNSSSKIWINDDLSFCFRKYVFEFVLHMIIWIIVSFNIGQRLKCSYRLWTFPIVLIRLASSIVLLTILSFHFYDYFFVDAINYQWIDIINIFVIVVTYLFICYLNFNSNLYHNTRPLSYTFGMITFFLVQNYDIYRIIIKHLTLMEVIYVTIRQSCLVIMSFSLLCICCHKCDRSMRTQSKYRFFCITFQH